MQRTGTARSCIVACSLAIGLFPAAAQERGGQEFAEVRLPSLLIGRSYSTWRIAPAPLAVHNPTSDTLYVHLRLVLPTRPELHPGARVLPDRNWAGIETRDLCLAPGEAMRTDVRLSLPYEPDLAGHTYQIDLVRTERTRSGGWRASTRSRLLFRAEMDYRDDTEIDFAAAPNNGPGSP